MKRTIIAMLALMGVALVAPAANAAEADRVPTTALIKVLPGAADTVYQDMDPIRICAGSETAWRYDGLLKMAIDYRSIRDGAKWKTIRFDLPANTLGCMYAVIHGHNDMKIRSRVLNNAEDYAGSISRTLIISVA